MHKIGWNLYFVEGKLPTCFGKPVGSIVFGGGMNKDFAIDEQRTEGRIVVVTGNIAVLYNDK